MKLLPEQKNLFGGALMMQVFFLVIICNGLGADTYCQSTYVPVPSMAACRMVLGMEGEHTGVGAVNSCVRERGDGFHTSLDRISRE